MKRTKKPEKDRRISVASAKGKGKRLQNWTCEQISELIGLPWGKDQMIASREASQTGTDVRLVGKAQVMFPFSVECKNQEAWRVPQWIEQAKDNQKEGTDWLLVMKKNYHEPVVVMDAEQFFDLLGRLEDDKESDN